MALSLCGISCLCAFVATSRHKVKNIPPFPALAGRNMCLPEQLPVKLRPSFGNRLAVVERFGIASPFGIGHFHRLASFVGRVGNAVASVEFGAFHPMQALWNLHSKYSTGQADACLAADDLLVDAIEQFFTLVVEKFGINAIVQLFADEREALLEEIRRAFVPRVEIAAAGLPVGGDVGGGDFVVNDGIRRPNGGGRGLSDGRPGEIEQRAGQKRQEEQASGARYITGSGGTSEHRSTVFGKGK